MGRNQKEDYSIIDNRPKEKGQISFVILLDHDTNKDHLWLDLGWKYKHNVNRELFISLSSPHCLLCVGIWNPNSTSLWNTLYCSWKTVYLWIQNIHHVNRLSKYIILTLSGDCGYFCITLIASQRLTSLWHAPGFVPMKRCFPSEHMTFPTPSRENLLLTHCIYSKAW